MGDNSLSNFARVDVIFSSRPRPAAFSGRPVVSSSDQSAGVPFGNGLGGFWEGALSLSEAPPMR